MPSTGRPAIFNRQSLFRSAMSDEVLPFQHRSSIVEAHTETSSSPQRLTQALLNSHEEAFKVATQTPFLRRAGSGKISKSTLSKWLSQDRLYAETYICFVSSLIARVNLPYCFVADKSQSLRWRIIRLLTAALENIHRELDFFTKTAEQYGLELDRPSTEGEDQPFVPTHATQQYMDLFRGFFNDHTQPLVEGMVVLWATEQCYLSAWTYASHYLDKNNDGSNDEDDGALRNAFIPNWSSSEFQKFVDEIADLTDALVERERASKKLEVYKAVWSHILDIETRFWPQVSDE